MARELFMDFLPNPIKQQLDHRAQSLGLSSGALIAQLLAHPSTESILQALPTATALLNAEGELISANAAFTQLMSDAPTWTQPIMGSLPDLPPSAPYVGRHVVTSGDGPHLCDIRLTPIPHDAGHAFSLVQIVPVLDFAQYTEFAEKSHEGLWAIDIEGRTLYANQAMADMLGYTLDELYTLTLWDIIHEEEAIPAEANRQKTQQGESLQLDFRFVHKQGHTVWVLLNTTPLTLADGEIYGAIGFIRDISARMTVEQALKEREARYKIITEIISDYAFAVRVDEDESMALEWVTGAYQQIVGEAPPEPGKIVKFDRTHPDDVTYLSDALTRLLANEPVTTISRFIRRDGEAVWLEVSRYPVWDEAQGRVVRFYGAARDVTARKQAEERLKESETRYRMLAELISDYIFSVAISPSGDLTVTWITGAYTEILGLPMPETPSPALSNRIHPDDLAIYEESMRHVLGNNPTTVRYRVQHQAGHYIWLEVKRTPIWDEGQQRVVGFYGAATDITARKTAETELATSEARFRAISDMTSDYAFSLIVHEDGSFEREWITDKAFERITGFTAEEVDTKAGWQALAHPDDVPRFAANLSEMLDGAEQTRLTYRIITKAGEVRYMEGQRRTVKDESGRVVKILGSARDVTDAYTAQQELAESEARFRTMANSAPVFIWMTDDKGNSIYVNDQWLTFTGRSFEEELGRGWESIIHPTDLPRCKAAYKHAFTQREPIRLEYRLRRHDGVYRWLREEAVPRFLPDGTFAGFIGTCIDITEMRSIQNALQDQVALKTRHLREANEELRRLTRLKDEWVSNVSHELRSPLTSLKVRFHVLSHNPNLLDTHLPVLQRETQRLADTIEDLLKLSRWDQGEVKLVKEQTNLHRLLSDYVLDRQIEAESQQITLRYIKGGPLPITLCDRGLISQVMGILLSNALKYTPAGGTITAKTHRREGQVGFSIHDDGPGIPPEEHDQLFERFFRGRTGRDSGKNGTGLGLAIAKEIVTHHGGTITVESSGQPGEGATFTVWLPHHSESET